MWCWTRYRRWREYVCPRKVAIDREKKAIFAAAIDPRGADDITSSTCATYGRFARDLSSAVYIDRSRLVVDRVRRPADGLAVKGILGAEVNDLRVQPAGRRREKSRSSTLTTCALAGFCSHSSTCITAQLTINEGFTADR